MNRGYAYPLNHGMDKESGVRMDGREFVHIPPPLLPGLPLEGVRGGVVGATGRLVSSTGHLSPLPTTKYLPTALTLHSHPGFPHLANNFYPSYIPINQLDPAGIRSPLLSQIGNPSIFESQKDGFYLSSHVNQPSLHSQTSISRTLANQAQNSHHNEKDTTGHSHKCSKESVKETKERVCRNELMVTSSRKEGRLTEDPQARSVLDYALEGRLESERKKGGQQRISKTGEYVSPYMTELVLNHESSNVETKAKNPPQTSLSNICNTGGEPQTKVAGYEQDKCAKDTSRHDENMRPSGHTYKDQAKTCHSLGTSDRNIPILCSCPSIQPSQTPSTFAGHPTRSAACAAFPLVKESARDHKVTAPTFVPSVDTRDERNGPVQIASQARDVKGKEVNKAGERPDVSHHILSPEYSSNSELKRVDALKEKGSLIRSNSSFKRAATSDFFLNHLGHVSQENKDLINCKESKESSKVYELAELQQKRKEHSHLRLQEQKWKPFEMGNFAATQMTVLAAQHSLSSHAEGETKKVYLDSPSLPRSSVSSRNGTESLNPSTLGETSAMQNLIKYSGSFAKETAAWQGGGKKNAFGGLGTMKSDTVDFNNVKNQQCLSHSGGKRDPERSESAKSFGREVIGAQGEVEVRHPPVGIAVAVARQKDNSGSKTGSSKGPEQSEENGHEQIRHREDRLLMGRLECEQEKLLRERKDFADFSRIHPTGSGANGLNSNLMVTGGPTLNTTGHWPADSTSQLAAQTWFHRGTTPPMWFTGHPYGFSHQTLHQGLSGTFTPGMTSSLPSAYQFVRDPQTGQIVVVPSEQLSHFEILDRSSALWQAMYSPTRSSLQHAHQLQLLSQQQLLRQHELYMLQQQAAHALELQRSAQLDALELQRSAQLDALELQRSAQLDALELQRTVNLDALDLQRTSPLVESFKVYEQQTEVENKIAKQNTGTCKQRLESHPNLLKQTVLLPSAPSSYSKSLSSPPLSPKAIPKSEHTQEGPTQEEHYEYLSNSHPSTTPPESSLPPTALIATREDICDEEAEKNSTDMEKGSTSSFTGLLTDLSSGFQFSPISPSFENHAYPVQPTSGPNVACSNLDLPLPAVKKMENTSEANTNQLVISKLLEPEVPASAEKKPSETLLNSETLNHQTLCISSADEISAEDAEYEHDLQLKNETSNFNDKKYQEQPVCETDCFSVRSLKPGKETCSTQTDFSSSFITSDKCQVNLVIHSQSSEIFPSTNDRKILNTLRNEESAHSIPVVMRPISDTKFSEMDKVTYELPRTIPMDIIAEDPLAGMNALVAATEMPEASPQVSKDKLFLPDINTNPVLQGIALLSEMAEIELEKRKKELENQQNCHSQTSLESLLAASSQMLMEVLSCPVLDSLKAESIQLPRELNPDKKYSWMQKRDETFSIRSSIENMDSVELDYRLRLAELQRMYKQKQRELTKLQRRRDSELKKCLLFSEDSEVGEDVLRRQMNVIEDAMIENVGGKIKNRIRSWEDDARASSYTCEVLTQSRKKQKSSNQELANKLDKSLSFTKQENVKSKFKFAFSSGGSQKYEGNSKHLTTTEFKENKTLRFPMLISNEGKNKMVSKVNMHVILKVKGQINTSHSPAFSEISNYSYYTDTEEEEDYLRNELVSPSNSRLVQSSMYSMLPRRIKMTRGCLQSTERAISSCSTVKTKQNCSKNKQLSLLQDAEVRSSFSDSTEDSIDQDFTSEEEDCVNYGTDHLPSPNMDESGLGLLARFAASVLPNPVTSSPISIIQLEAKQKAKKKEERQCLIGSEFQYSDSERELKVVRNPSPSTVLTSSLEVESALPVLTEEETCVKSLKKGSIMDRPRKIKKFKSPRNLSEEFGQEVSDDDQWGRRRSERIFLNDAVNPSSLLPVPTNDVNSMSKSNRYTKMATVSPKKGNQRKDHCKFSTQAWPLQPTGDTRHGEKGEPGRRGRWQTPTRQTKMTEINICSLNVKGLNTPSKRYKLCREMKRHKKKKGKELMPSCLSPNGTLASVSVSRLNMTSSVTCSRKTKLKSKTKDMKKENRGKGGAVSKLMESMAAEEDFEPNQDSSFSEDENVPLCLHPERPNTPAPRSCIIDKEELKDGLRVLIPMDDKLLYAGHVQTVHSPDIYRVIIEGERGNRPHIYCQEQLLQEAIIDVKPPSIRFLPEGTRIAAYWSQQYRCLYPGTVVQGSLDQKEDSDLITVEFDDGDTGRIPLSHIRLLPPDYKIQCAEPSPALLVPSAKPRSRKSSKEQVEAKEAGSTGCEEVSVKSKSRGRKQNLKQITGETIINEDTVDKESLLSTKICLEKHESSQTSIKLGTKILQIPEENSPTHGTPKIRKPEQMKTAKLCNAKQTIYTGRTLGKVENGNPPCDLTVNLFDQLEDTKKIRKLEEQRDFVSLSTKQGKAENDFFVKLDHEGVMSPKTKKAKEAMMWLEDASVTMKKTRKCIMGVSYAPVKHESKQKLSRSKPHLAKHTTACDSEALSSSLDKYKKKSDQKQGLLDPREESDGSSSNSESEGEEDKENKQKQAQGDESSSSSQSSTSVCLSKSSSGTSSSSSSSSSSSCSSSSASSSSSSSSSSTTDEDSSSTSEDETQELTSNPTNLQISLQKGSIKPAIKPGTPQIQNQRQKKQEQKKGSKNTPKKREGIHLPTTKELAKRQRLPSVENRPKIAAFLPARQLWKWFGKPTQRRGMKGKARKLFYKAIVRGKEIIRIGDCAVFLSAGRPNLPYIGRIQSMWESWGNNMVVRVKWFYHPEETNPGKKLNDTKSWDQKSGKSSLSGLQMSSLRKDFMERALYQSSHVDENDVQTVSHKCLVVALEQYEQMLKTKKYQDSEDLYYLAGTYEPTTGMIFNTDGVPVIC
ncbi:trinucleotide repeat-containing gene 18 protein isoform X5 [Xenopus tropicalis]|uniref:Trinucleotide repeat-containing gene 18 protein isoform X5 n=1 Tax=Xenopus tropicalis TaxID=8364 RepID=A0A8J1ISZ6_XENTR|nr:trinucleotide repeat-containing gene 18 protein isoform X5 [Xenopus tropicalis]